MKRDMTLVKNQLMVQSIKRWHIVPTCGEQTVADHTYGVMVIARKIWIILTNELRDVHFTAQDKRFMNLAEVLLTAMEHDWNEVGHGDMPPRDGNFDDLFQGFIEMPIINRIVKMADIMEAIFALDRLSPTDHGNYIRRRLIEKAAVLSHYMLSKGFVEISDTDTWSGVNERVGNGIIDMLNEQWNYTVERGHE